jgi:hypothetical protein
MTNSSLSPAAQAIKDAVLALYSDERVHKIGWRLDAPTAAAALRAAADQMGCYQSKKFLYSIADAMKLQNIADELERSTTENR